MRDEYLISKAVRGLEEIDKSLKDDAARKLGSAGRKARRKLRTTNERNYERYDNMRVDGTNRLQRAQGNLGVGAMDIAGDVGRVTGRNVRRSIRTSRNVTRELLGKPTY